MKKLLIVSLLITICYNQSFSQSPGNDTLWRKGGLVAINFNQVSLNNWAAGGENSLALNSLLNLFANYKKNKIAWDSNLDLGYGILKQGDADLRKNEDKIELNTKLGYEAHNANWYYTVLFNFKSQFAKGYAYPNDSQIVSKFGAPAYALISLGMDYKPSEHFSLFLSPLTAKFTIVNDQTLADGGAYGVDKAEFDGAGIKTKDGKKLRAEYGAYLNAKYQKEIIQNVTLSTKLELFSNYAKNPQNIDVNWEVLISMKVNKYITASINTQLVYDDNTPVPLFEGTGTDKVASGFGPRTQFKEVLGVGLTYKFNSYSVK